MTESIERPITAVVAMTPGGVIGRDGSMPWRLSSDLKRFKQLTMGGVLVMGRKTYESIGRPFTGSANDRGLAAVLAFAAGCRGG